MSSSDPDSRLPPLIPQKYKTIGVVLLVVAVIGFAVYRSTVKGRQEREEGLQKDRTALTLKLAKVKQNSRLAKVQIEPNGGVEGHYRLTGTVELDADKDALIRILMTDNLYHVLEVEWLDEVEVTSP